MTNYPSAHAFLEEGRPMEPMDEYNNEIHRYNKAERTQQGDKID